MAYVARTEDFDCGIMISASHNPYYDNGIKLINGNGEKMDEATINLVEAYLDSELEVFGRKYEEIPFAHKNAIGCTVDYAAGRNRYMGYLISLGLYSFKGMKVGLDCANGSSWNIFPCNLVSNSFKTRFDNFSNFCRILFTPHNHMEACTATKW